MFILCVSLYVSIVPLVRIGCTHGSLGHGAKMHVYACMRWTTVGLWDGELHLIKLMGLLAYSHFMLLISWRCKHPLVGVRLAACLFKSGTERFPPYG